MVEKWIDMQKAEAGVYMVNPAYDQKLQEINQKILKVKNSVESLRMEVGKELEIDVKLVDSNSHTFLFSVNKKKGDQVLFLFKGISPEQ